MSEHKPSTKLQVSRFLVRYGSHVLFLLAIVLLALSSIRTDYPARLQRQVNRVERSLHKRERLAEVLDRLHSGLAVRRRKR